MGEYAEMMLDGTCCAQCGEFLESRSDGYARLCPSCDDGDDRPPKPRRKMGKATKKLLLQFHATKKQLEIPEIYNPLWSLLCRGYIEHCKRWGFYKITEEGAKMATNIISQSGTIPERHR